MLAASLFDWAQLHFGADLGADWVVIAGRWNGRWAGHRAVKSASLAAAPQPYHGGGSSSGSDDAHACSVAEKTPGKRGLGVRCPYKGLQERAAGLPNVNSSWTAFPYKPWVWPFKQQTIVRQIRLLDHFDSTLTLDSWPSGPVKLCLCLFLTAPLSTEVTRRDETKQRQRQTLDWLVLVLVPYYLPLATPLGVASSRITSPNLESPPTKVPTTFNNKAPSDDQSHFSDSLSYQQSRAELQSSRSCAQVEAHCHSAPYSTH